MKFVCQSFLCIALLGQAWLLAAQPSEAESDATDTMTISKSVPFSFGVIGDAPYSEREANLLKHVLLEMDADTSLSFVVHVGDIKDGSEPCNDELLEARKALLNQSQHSLILLPGDNEWTDCHRRAAGGFDPVERLNRLRELFYDDEFSLGKNRMSVLRQSDVLRFKPYRENMRWEHNNTLFVAVNLPGSNNNYRVDAGRNSEFEERLIANHWWLQRAFAVAKQKKIRTLVVLTQADPLFENTLFVRKKNRPRTGLLPNKANNTLPSAARDGYAEFKILLADLAAEFAENHQGQVLFIHGDTHRFRVDQPIRDEKGQREPYLTRLETYGSPFVNNWIKVTIDPSSEKRFTIDTFHVAGDGRLLGWSP